MRTRARVCMYVYYYRTYEKAVNVLQPRVCLLLGRVVFKVVYSNRPKLDYFDSALLSSTCYLKRCGNTSSKTLIFAGGPGKTVYMSAITRILCGGVRWSFAARGGELAQILANPPPR